MKQEVKKKLEKLFSEYMIQNVSKYQKEYGFDMENNSTHNNEADAFKHTFMQAFLALYGSQSLAKSLGDMHEKDGNKNNQPKGEEEMDLHNNQQGREIAKDIINQYGILIKNPILIHYTNDIIAEKVWQRMNAGKIILDPSVRTKLKDRKRKSSSDKSGKTSCVGSYPVSGYTRSSGVEVKGYTRTCGAKHQINSSKNNNRSGFAPEQQEIKRDNGGCWGGSGVVMSAKERQKVLDKYKGKKVQDLSKSEIAEFLKAYLLGEMGIGYFVRLKTAPYYIL